MVAEASDEGVREQTVEGKNQDHSPWRWGPGDQEGPRHVPFATLQPGMSRHCFWRRDKQMSLGRRRTGGLERERCPQEEGE